MLWVCGVAFIGVPASGGTADDEPLVDLSQVDPTIVIELRYATAHNLFGHPIYSPEARCLVRSGVAERLKVAQQFLRSWNAGLKVWDAYRPPYAQTMLWEHVKNPEFAADPASGQALHLLGIAVDLTLVDREGHELLMPTDFDDFTPAARSTYLGENPTIIWDLRLLKNAMYRGGFYESRSEWWHFMPRDWKRYAHAPPPRITPETSKMDAPHE